MRCLAGVKRRDGVVLRCIYALDDGHATHRVDLAPGRFVTWAVAPAAEAHPEDQIMTPADYNAAPEELR